MGSPPWPAAPGTRGGGVPSPPPRPARTPLPPPFPSPPCECRCAPCRLSLRPRPCLPGRVPTSFATTITKRSPPHNDSATTRERRPKGRRYRPKVRPGRGRNVLRRVPLLPDGRAVEKMNDYRSSLIFGHLQGPTGAPLPRGSSRSSGFGAVQASSPAARRETSVPHSSCASRRPGAEVSSRMSCSRGCAPCATSTKFVSSVKEDNRPMLSAEEVPRACSP